MSSESLQSAPFGPDVYSGTHRLSAPDWAAVKAAGADFAFVKKSQGNFYTNPFYVADSWEAAQVGLYVGSYHFLSYRSLPADQVSYYLAGVRSFMNGQYFQPVLDFENQSDTGEPLPVNAKGEPFYPSPAYMLNWAHDFIIQCKAATGLYPILYTYPYFFRNVLGNPQGDPWDKCPLWIADYSHRNPQQIGSWPWHTFHQYTSTGHVDGISVSVDLNRFNGDMAGLARMAGTK